MNGRVATALVDALFLMLFVFILLPHQQGEDRDQRLLGDIVVEATWPDGSDADVDLWVKSPDDLAAVGFSRTRGTSLSLFRDVLGVEPQPARYEMIAGRFIADGEYIVNLHLYMVRKTPVPVIVNVTVWYRRPLGANSRVTIWTGNVALTEQGHELTVVRWRSQNGVHDPRSIHHTQIVLTRAET